MENSVSDKLAHPFVQHLQEECGVGAEFRCLIDNLSDEEILDSIDSYQYSKYKQLKEAEIMKHLDFEKARQEATVMNALIRAGVVNEDSKLSNDKVIESGLKKLTE